MTDKTPSNQPASGETSAQDEHRLIQQRREKLMAVRERGIDPYPARFKRSHTVAAARALFESGPQDSPSAPVTIAGRIVARRGMGKASFVDIRDGSGRMQVHMRSDVLGDGYALLDDIDIGDFLGVRGPVFKTRRGEVSIEAQEITLLSKSLRPPPEKWHGLQDTEQRFRQKYLDLISNERAMELAVMRSKVVASMRRFLHDRGFIEVETPILVPVAAGAMAKPFVTHHNALDRTLYLRIASELYLKRLIVGGIDRVFEIGRMFRNEGMDHDHNPEFTTLESYQAYADYSDVMEMVEQMVSSIARDVLGTDVIKQQGDGTEISLKPPWPRLDLRAAILERTEIDILKHKDAHSLAAAMRERGIHVEAGSSKGRLLDKIISSEVEPHLIQPTFLVDYPVEMSPLAKRKPGVEGIVERFEAFAMGSEVANSFTELNDPDDQRSRFEEQEALRTQYGDAEETDRLDEDFLVAVEHGMPPTGGLGMGIDRLTMLLSGERSIREIILFPQLRT